MCEKRIEEHDKQVQQQNLEEEKDSILNFDDNYQQYASDIDLPFNNPEAERQDLYDRQTKMRRE